MAKSEKENATPAGYEFSEGNTTVNVTGISHAAGVALESMLKGQVEASTDHQLKSAIRAGLSRMGFGSFTLEITRANEG